MYINAVLVGVQLTFDFIFVAVILAAVIFRKK